MAEVMSRTGLVRFYYEDGEVLVVDKKLLAAVLTFAGNDREPIKVLRVEPGRIAACDGKVLVIAMPAVSGDAFEPFNVDASWLAKEIRPALMKLVALRPDRESKTLIVERRNPTNPDAIEATVEAKVLRDVEFPPVDRVLPSRLNDSIKTRASFCLDPRIAVRLGKLADASEASGFRFQLCKGDHLGPIRYDGGASDDSVTVCGCVMPMRGTNTEKETTE